MKITDNTPGERDVMTLIVHARLGSDELNMGFPRFHYIRSDVDWMREGKIVE